MKTLKAVAAGLCLVSIFGMVQAADMTKEQAIAEALKLHPGTVDKAYQETKKGELLWEVKIKEENGSKWEVFFNAASGEFAKEEKVD